MITDIHDYEVTQISMIGASGEVRFQFRGEDNILVSWTMHGVAMMRLTELYEGNVVLECERMNPRGVPRELWERLLEHRVDSRNMDREIESLKNKVGTNGVFIYITPSYGMTCCLLCERLTETAATDKEFVGP